MKHYICTGGCDGETREPGVCQSEGCRKEGEPLNACDCADGAHRETLEKKDDSSDEEE